MADPVAPPDLVGSVDAGGYRVLVAPGLLDRTGEHVRAAAPAHRYAIVSDSNVAPRYAAHVAAQLPAGQRDILTFPAGEGSKTRATWQALTDDMLARGYGRDSVVVALGGGVVGDLAGFVAATFMRGIPVVQIPTTLLAMIDAAVGGKTGVDTPAGKNLVGAFHPPAIVLADPQTLATLDPGELRAGVAEALKHGVIADAAYFDAVRDGAARLADDDPAARDPAFAGGVILRSVEIKARVVRADAHERGVRKTLNFGHTVGHAIELLSGFTIRHGEAVGIGMVVESRAGECAGITAPGTSAAIADALARVGLPTRRPAGPSVGAVIDAMRADKKSRGGTIEYAIPERIGVMAGAGTGHAVPLDDRLLLELLG